MLTKPLNPLAEMLDGTRRTADDTELWDSAAARIVGASKGGTCRIEAAVLSPAKQHLATCSGVSTLFGLRVHHIGAVYDLTDNSIVGRLAEGKRGAKGWNALHEN
jgi:hypothetical protein